MTILSLFWFLELDVRCAVFVFTVCVLCGGNLITRSHIECQKIMSYNAHNFDMVLLENVPSVENSSFDHAVHNG